MKIKYPRILIISPEPYNANSTARTLNTFFKNWDKSCMAQIYFNSVKPCYEFCNNLFQITDINMLKRHFKNIQTGKIYRSSMKENTVEVNAKHKIIGNIFDMLYKIGRKKTPFIHVMRSLIWKEKYWKTDLLEKWLESFNPEIIFFDLIDDNYGCEIALYIARKRNIPIVSFICDDYYFNNYKNISLFYHYYRRKYKRIAKNIILSSSDRIYVCDMIKDRYSAHFKNKGKIIYTTSEIKPSIIKPNNRIPIISYLGNISIDRWKSLIDIGDALQKISQELKINVYSNENNSNTLKNLSKGKGVVFYGNIQYNEVENIMKNSDLVVHVEDFSMKNIRKTKYSLSTKIADCLSCGTCLLAYGPENIGSIDYLIKNDCACVVTDKKRLLTVLNKIIIDKELRRNYVNKALIIANINHNEKNNFLKMKRIVDEVLERKM